MVSAEGQPRTQLEPIALRDWISGQESRWRAGPNRWERECGAGQCHRPPLPTDPSNGKIPLSWKVSASIMQVNRDSGQVNLGGDGFLFRDGWEPKPSRRDCYFVVLIAFLSGLRGTDPEPEWRKMILSTLTPVGREGLQALGTWLLLRGLASPRLILPGCTSRNLSGPGEKRFGSTSPAEFLERFPACLKPTLVRLTGLVR